MFLRRVQPPLEDERSEPPGEYPLSRTLCLELRSLRGAGQDEKWTVATQVEVPQQKSLNHLESIQNHMESIHFPGHFVWNCDLCGEQAKTRNGLSQHKSKFHSKKNSID